MVELTGLLSNLIPGKGSKRNQTGQNNQNQNLNQKNLSSSKTLIGRKHPQKRNNKNGASVEERDPAKSRWENPEDIIIEVRNFHLYFGDKHVLKGVSMPIYKNKVTAIIGPSGCGKSTFIRSINRMNDLVEGVKTEGEILIDGKNIYAHDVDVVKLRRNVGMVFQKPNPFPKSIYDNISYGPKIHGIKNKRRLDEIVEKGLRDAGLYEEVKDNLKENAYSLSGGQQQRLCIARALAVEPEIILMDEPTSALDPLSTSKIEDLVDELKKDYTVVIVTHNMQQAARISDFTAFLYLGELIEFGHTTQIFEEPKNERTERYITGRFG